MESGPEKKAVFMNWSGGKDSAMALHLLRQDPQIDLKCLVTTLSRQYRRISMHGVRERLLDLQALRMGIPLKKIWLPENTGMHQYSRIMEKSLLSLKKQGIGYAAFGDIFLEDLRAWREKQLDQIQMKALFPIWKSGTGQLARDFIAAGFRALVVCVDAGRLDRRFAGRIFDQSLLDQLPADVDPCGENGEFHSFVFDGPGFAQPVDFTLGQIVERSYPLQSGSGQDGEVGKGDHRFYFCDLLPV